MGHPPEAVWGYTPRMMAGFLHFAHERRQREAAETLSLAALAARGDPKDVTKTLKQLGGE